MNRNQSSLFQQFEETVVNFIKNDNGIYVAISDDVSFIKVFRSTLQKHLMIPESALRIYNDDKTALKDLKKLSIRKKKNFIFLERVLGYKQKTSLLNEIKNKIDNIYIVLLTTEVDRSILIYLHEIGADNFITKPISVNTLIEKIALTLKPQGKIGQLIGKGKSLVESGNFEAALAISEEILKIKPNSAGALMVKGDAYKNLGMRDQALEAYEAASREALLYLEPLKKLAGFFEESGDKKSQLKFLEKLDKLSPLNLDRKIDMGSINVDLGKIEKAEGLFDQAVKLASKETTVFVGDVNMRIAELCLEKDPQLSEKFYRQALDSKKDKLDTSDIETFNRLGIALRKQGKWQEAIEEYKKALDVDPDEANLYYNMAMAYSEGKRKEDAYRSIMKAYRLNESFYNNNDRVAYNAGMICFNAKELEDALKFFKIALKINPGNTKAQKRIREITK